VEQIPTALEWQLSHSRDSRVKSSADFWASFGPMVNEMLGGGNRWNGGSRRACAGAEKSPSCYGSRARIGGIWTRCASMQTVASSHSIWKSIDVEIRSNSYRRDMKTNTKSGSEIREINAELGKTAPVVKASDEFLKVTRTSKD
jgi:hypothetical protein